jgi:hypothetical protein
MRRGLGVAVMVTVVTLALGTVAQRGSATQMCSTMCAGGEVLSCTASTTCSSSPGTIVCCGTAYTCTPYDTWQACSLSCISKEQQCFHSCNSLSCDTQCADEFELCKGVCGSEPPLSFSC